jgi:hypothetical protein
MKEELQLSDAVASDQLVEPTSQEKKCLSAYCNLSLVCKKAEELALEKTKHLKPIIKDLRGKLLEALKETQCEILLIPRDLRKEADKRLASLGLPALPPYIRLIKNNKDLSINAETINDAIESLSLQDLDDLEECENGKEALIKCVLNSLRRVLRSYSEQIKLTESVPRCIKACDVMFANEELALEAIRLHEESSTVLHTESEKRDNIAQAKHEMASKFAEVEMYFNRSSLTHQRVVLENQPYNLCKRISVIKPKLTIKLLEEMLDKGLKQLKTKQDAIKYLENNKESLIKSVLKKVETMPSTTKVKIHLQKIHLST